MDKVLKEVRWGIIGVGDVTEKKSGPRFSTGGALRAGRGHAPQRGQGGGLR